MITEAEKRIKAAIDRALEMEATAALCDVGDLLELLKMVNAARLPVARKHYEALVETEAEWERRVRNESAKADANQLPDEETD